ncbi:Sulfotransferase family cytosolic 2B member 1 [Collichthys lucidus]|uniref:Sulfotransferase n=1 Tax=Collichthys lucidus TaxID=240159 RepID=A0A4U5VNQ7_COLLU|nr:Sulfotransferase family cytosolic 2B member 1 [Collichthys lucidus]
MVAIFKTEVQAALTENLSNIKTELWAVNLKLSDSIRNIQSDVCALKGTVGTTWMQEIVPLIMSGGDPASVETLPNWRRVPWMEVDNTCKLNLNKDRLHVINVMRNPKDVFTSSFHFYGMASFLVNPGPQSEFLHKFLDGKVMFGSWFDHVKSWLNAEDKDRIMYISYEEMIMDLKDSVARIAQFLEKPLDTEVMEKIADRCLFKNMKQNKMSNYSTIPREFMDQTKSEFLRKGIAGDWKNQLTVAEAEYFDAVYKDKMKDVKYIALNRGVKLSH